ncbi:hypothetical protein TSUD_285780 [Trifolium subterraneum]|uniref:Uncharacterized protein n=1 Tax=Trifolium subterraneum TaxID=3900 RepID=A0A2Z6PID7_TRISU|nr:hypothetical protein TSUD_285780 [Trifolium subterraneum]
MKQHSNANWTALYNALASANIGSSLPWVSQVAAARSLPSESRQIAPNPQRPSIASDIALHRK